MMQAALFEKESPVAARQPKTDRLFLAHLVRDAGNDKGLDHEGHVDQAHQIVLKWADLEASGRLAGLTETQLEGDFVAEIFGQVLGYVNAAANEQNWNVEAKRTIHGQTPDAVLGFFQQDQDADPLAVIELKGPLIHLDRDRSNGRTAVDQCWDYLVNVPTTCRWGIVTNMVSFRLYERDSTKRAYEHFTLQSLRSVEVFRRFYAIFRRKGLIEKTAKQEPKSLQLLKKSRDRQREVGDELYKTYSEHRLHFIQHLHNDLEHPVEKSIEFAQRLLDRVIFIAFCEDRGLLPQGTIRKAYEELPAFSAITNPRWQNFKTLFRFVDQGEPVRAERVNGYIPAYNGGLFAVSAADELELDDRWTNFFNTIAGYDFADEVNLDVLGHLFERSITELEKLKTTGLLEDAEKADQYARMPQSAKRKQLGIYYTPPELTSRIVQYTVEELIDQRFVDWAVELGEKRKQAERGAVPDTVEFWQGCLEILQDLKVVDPACGSGAFLFQAYNSLEARYFEVIGHLEQFDKKASAGLAEQVPQWILQDNLYGVDLSPEAVEITQLALWIRSATPGQTLAKLSENIVHGNSLVHDPAVDPHAFDWRERFPQVFAREQQGFDCVIGNPPWERIKLQEREFFSLPAPQIATATNAAKRRQIIATLESDDPSLYERYHDALAAADSLLTYCRKSKAYPLTGKGDINLYAVFAELAYQLVAPNGRVGFLTPSGIASDKTTKDFFAAIAESKRLIRLYDFENKKIYFPDVHASFKFCILNYGGSATATKAADFVFFVHQIEQLEDKQRHISLSGDDIKLLNPNTRTCPIFRTRRDAEITKAIYRRVPVLIDLNREGPTGNPWGIKFKTMFHQTNDAELFREADTLKGEKFQLKGNRWVKGKQKYLPLYEAKMYRSYDHRHGTVYEDTSNWINQGQTHESTLVQHQNPEYLVQPRFWSAEAEITERLTKQLPSCLLSFRDITRETDVRTFISTLIPAVGFINTAPIILFEAHEEIAQCCILANFNSIAFDFVAKKKCGHIHMNFFIVEQLPVLPPDTYAKPTPWQRNTKLETWISERVLKLTCTAEDMLPLADACGFSSGSFTQEPYNGRLNKWDEAERAQLMAELDAAYFHLYGFGDSSTGRDDVEYILSTFKGIHDSTSLFPNNRSTAEQILHLFDKYAKR